jgi:hypothetical protein
VRTAHGLALGQLDSLAQAGDDLAKRLSCREVTSRREEHLSVAQAMRRRIDDRLVRDARPVFPVADQLLDEPEDREERVERFEPIQLRRVLGWELPAVLASQLDDG